MNWKELFKPTIGKIIYFILIVLIIGVPSKYENCLSYFPVGFEGPSCIAHFGFANVIVFLKFISGSFTLDAFKVYRYNPFLITGYLIGVYSLLSLLFYFVRKKSIR